MVYLTGTRSRCSVPNSDDSSSILSRQVEDVLWGAFFTAAPARRRVFEPNSKRRKRAAGPLSPIWPRPEDVRKWCSRTTTADAPMGPKAPKSTVLTPAEEAVGVAFRQKTLLPLDDVLGLPEGHDPQPQSQRVAPLPPASWHLPAARREDQGAAQAIQDLRDRLRSH